MCVSAQWSDLQDLWHLNSHLWRQNIFSPAGQSLSKLMDVEYFSSTVDFSSSCKCCLVLTVFLHFVHIRGVWMYLCTVQDHSQCCCTLYNDNQDYSMLFSNSYSSTYLGLGHSGSKKSQTPLPTVLPGESWGVPKPRVEPLQCVSPCSPPDSILFYSILYYSIQTGKRLQMKIWLECESTLVGTMRGDTLIGWCTLNDTPEIHPQAWCFRPSKV